LQERNVVRTTVCSVQNRRQKVFNREAWNEKLTELHWFLVFSHFSLWWLVHRAPWRCGCLCIACKYNCQCFEILVNIFLTTGFAKTRYRKWNPDQGTPVTFARLWHWTQTVFWERFIVVHL